VSVFYSVTPLGLAEAVALFEDRAHEDDLPLREVEHICQRLDGLPLAIELAAARTRVMSLATLRKSLDRSIGALADVRVDRRRSLEASIRWSYDLLGEPERAAFRALAVFEGPFDLEAGTFTAAVDEATVLSLVDRSLLVRAGDRYRLLYPVREFARSELKLVGSEVDAAARHDAHLVQWARAMRDRSLYRQPDLIRTVQSVRDEIRPALDRLKKRSPEDFAVLAAVFVRALFDWGDLHDADDIARQAVAAIHDDHPGAAFVHLAAGFAAWRVADFDRAARESDRASHLAIESGDTEVEPWARLLAADSLGGLGRHAEALARVAGGLDSTGIEFTEVGYYMLNTMAIEYWHLGNYLEGVAAAKRALVLSNEAAPSRAIALDTLALCFMSLGEATAAADAGMEAVDLILQHEMPVSTVYALDAFARIALMVGDMPIAAAFAATAGRLAGRQRFPFQVRRNPVWEEPIYAVLIEQHPDAAGSFDGLGWREALLSAIDWWRTGSDPQPSLGRLSDT
jgi:tetratricopeptide (TPR) repeat protein